MSVLSQFFPSGETLKADFVLVGGGGGGAAAATAPCAFPGVFSCAFLHRASYSGGGGGGQVTVGEDYEVTRGRTYSIVIGSGGAGGCLLPNPAAVVSPDLYAVGPNAPFAACTAWGTPGGTGGTSFFGSVTALGGGGGASYIPGTCVPLIPQLPATYNSGFGCSGGSGGGNAYSATLICTYYTAGSTTCPSGSGMNNYSIGNTIKFGAPGRDFTNSLSEFYRQYATFWPTAVYPTGNITTCTIRDVVSYVNFASGGGGAGGAGSGGAGSLSITLNGQDLVQLCPGFPIQTSAYSTFRGSATSGASSGRTCTGIQRSALAIDHLSGGDGFETTITGTPQYYGGGGEAFGGQIKYNPGITPYGPSAGIYGYDHTAVSSLSPCYPQVPLKSRLGNGGLGGGAYRLLSVARPGIAAGPYSPYFTRACRISSPGNWISRYEYETANSQYVLCGSVANSGGGGTSGATGYVNTTTGPCAANPIVSDGSNGSSGTFIIRYPTQFPEATVTGDTPVTQTGGYRTYKWNGPGTFTIN